MSSWPYPFWFAHRGAGKLAPENTLAALRIGAGHGFQAFECDVKLSSDQTVFLLHDDELDRTTNAQGPAHTLDWHALSQLDAGSWHSPLFAGEPLASLESIARFCLANRYSLNLEIKPSPGLEVQTGRVVASMAAQRWSHAQSWPLLSSFKPDALWGARASAPQVPRALLLSSLHDRLWLDKALELDCIAVVIHHAALQATHIHEAQGRGLKVLSYTVNEAPIATRLRQWGIDGLITDIMDPLFVQDFTN